MVYKGRYQWPWGGFSRRLLLLLLLFAPLSPFVHGWSEGGHIAIAELAVRQLDAEARKHLNGVAEQLTAQNSQTPKLNKRYQGASAVALIASWTDSIRGLTLQEVFARYGRRVPAELTEYQRQTTDDWHYSNVPYHGDENRATRFAAQCSINSGQLNSVLPLLQQAYGGAKDPRDRAIVLAMLVHFIADAHQPLHTITRVTDGCNHDRGGNAFCAVKRDAGGRCKNNLHRAWDSGFGFFYQKDFGVILAAIAAEDTAVARPAPKRDQRPEALQPELWQKENLALADQVYDTMEGAKPSRAYRIKSERIIRQRSAVAAMRLAAVLEALLVSD